MTPAIMVIVEAHAQSWKGFGFNFSIYELYYNMIKTK